MKKIGDPDAPISPEEQFQRLLGYLDLIVRDDSRRYARVVASMREADLYASDEEAYQAWLAQKAKCTEEQIGQAIDDLHNPEDEVTVVVDYESGTLPDDLCVAAVDDLIDEIAQRHRAEFEGSGTWMLDATLPRDCTLTVDREDADALIDDLQELLDRRGIRGNIRHSLED